MYGHGYGYGYVDSFSRMEPDVHTTGTVEDVMICCVVVETSDGSEFKPRFPTSSSGLYGVYVLGWDFSRRSFLESL